MNKSGNSRNINKKNVPCLIFQMQCSEFAEFSLKVLVLINTTSVHGKYGIFRFFAPIKVSFSTLNIQFGSKSKSKPRLSSCHSVGCLSGIVVLAIGLQTPPRNALKTGLLRSAINIWHSKLLLIPL